MGRFRLEEEAVFGLDPTLRIVVGHFFIMRKAVAAIRRRNTLSAVPLAIQKPAGQANNQTCWRLQRFFVLTKRMSVVGTRPALPNEVATYNDYQRQRLLVKPGMTCYWQTRRNRDSITFDEWVDLDLWRARPVRRYAGACMLCCRQPAG